MSGQKSFQNATTLWRQLIANEHVVGVAVSVVMDAIDEMIDGLEHATGLCLEERARPEFKRKVWDIIFARTFQGGVGVDVTRGGQTQTAVHARKIARKISELELILDSETYSHYFSAFYDGRIAEVNEQSPNFESLRFGLTQLRAVADERLQSLKARRAIKGSHRERLIVHALTELYEQTFPDRRAVISRNLDGEATGPFVRFCIYLERETNPKEDPEISGELVATAIKRQKRKTRPRV